MLMDFLWLPHNLTTTSAPSVSHKAPPSSPKLEKKFASGEMSGIFAGVGPGAGDNPWWLRAQQGWQGP